MGELYGNITTLNRTHFQFDKIYSSRYEMELNLNKDDIFAGRFVLVQYTQNQFSEGDILLVYRNENDNTDTNLYIDSECELPLVYVQMSNTKVTNPVAANWEQYYWRYASSDNYHFYFKLPSQDYFNSQEDYYTIVNGPSDLSLTSQFITNGQLVKTVQYIPVENNNNNNNQVEYTVRIRYYTCTGGATAGDRKPTLQEIRNIDDNQYFINYNIDKTHYAQDGISLGPNVRGYDGTVWQKVYNGGIGSYIFIAYLNAMIPIFSLVSDPPSSFPKAPYFDTSSTDFYYRVHVPTMWGFQVKEAESASQSDMIISQTRHTYQPYNNAVIGTNTSAIQADIYFNKKANNKLYKYYDADVQNEIKLIPGASGKWYYKNGEFQQSDDTYELSLHLPMIGNMISDGYDLIYGTNPVENANDQVTRPTDINWYPGDQEQLKTYGNSSLGGKSYDLNTIAGTLNTLHSRLGQIIVEIETRPEMSIINQYSPDYIYYVRDEDKYFRVSSGYNYTELENEDYTFNVANNVTFNNYLKDTYYEKNGNNYTISISYDSQNPPTLYKKNITNEMYHIADPQPISYTSNQYYLKRGSDYIVDKDEVPSSPAQQYYTITNTNAILGSSFSGQYQQNTYYYRDENNSYIRDSSYLPTPNRVYYNIGIAPTLWNNVIFYQKDTFYYKIDNAYQLCTAETVNDIPQGINTVYWLEFDETQDIIYSYMDGEGHTQTIIGHPLKEAHGLQLISMANLPADTNTLYYQDSTNNRYIPFNKLGDYLGDNNGVPIYATRGTFVTISNDSVVQQNLYVTGKYYEIIDGNYILSYENLKQENNYTYYTFNNNSINAVNAPFYISGKYYYNTGTNRFDIDLSKNYTNGRTYYTKDQLFVIADYTGRCPYGYEWNDQALFVPASVTLGRRIESPQFVEIKNFMDGSGSINGHLLKLEKYLEIDNEDIRDKNTFRGSLNLVQDYLFLLSTMIPGRLLYVNDFGQIDSFEVGNGQKIILYNNGVITTMTLSELKNALNNA